MYEGIFGRDKLVLLLFEELTKSREPLSEVYRRLGADPAFEPPSWGRVIHSGGAAEVFLASDLRRELEAYYEEPNIRLAERFDLDLSPWFAS